MMLKCRLQDPGGPTDRWSVTLTLHAEEVSSRVNSQALWVRG